VAEEEGEVGVVADDEDVLVGRRTRAAALELGEGRGRGRERFEMRIF
jgi:hypothetical protein